MSKIFYTYTDEAPAMATFSLFPFIKKFLNKIDIDIELVDISLSGRVLAAFNKQKDFLKILGDLTLDKKANIIKLPNISASIPQLQACIKELQDKGYNIPNYPQDPQNDEEKKIKDIYSKVLGSAVNPVLREGNSDRRCANSVKEYAKQFPHKNGKFGKENLTKVAYMQGGDFYSNEKSKIFDKTCNLTIEFVDKNGKNSVLKNLKIEKNEVVDATFLSSKKLDDFIENTIKLAKNDDLLYSVHLKATMMKVSDPVIFGHFVKVFFKEIFTKFDKELKSVGINPNNGLKDLFERIKNLNCKDEIEKLYKEILTKNPDIAMVDSDKGITNLHVPSDVIIDASMPAMIRNSGKMWDKNGELKYALAVIPDFTYAVLYDSFIEDLKNFGELDPAKIGSVANVGLMAKKAQEYGSHDKTFIAENDGVILVKDENGEIVFEFCLEKGDIFRMTQTKDEAIKNWIKLAILRAKATKSKTIFWLDENRPADKTLINIVKNELKNYDLNGLDIEILKTADAVKLTNKIIREGKNCISVTGNVLRDYLTDLYPIMELGTSAKMLSIVPLLNGGGLFETGAGGSAPKIASQLIEENHLRWDSLGEFLALGVSLEHFSEINGDKNSEIFSKAIDSALKIWLKNDKSPKKKVGEIDVRSSHFYFIKYLANELKNSDLSKFFVEISDQLDKNEEKINQEILSTQGKKVDLGGYYKFDENKANLVMRPSKTLNEILEDF